MPQQQQQQKSRQIINQFLSMALNESLNSRRTFLHIPNILTVKPADLFSLSLRVISLDLHINLEAVILSKEKQMTT